MADAQESGPELEARVERLEHQVASLRDAVDALRDAVRTEMRNRRDGTRPDARSPRADVPPDEASPNDVPPSDLPPSDAHKEEGQGDTVRGGTVRGGASRPEATSAEATPGPIRRRVEALLRLSSEDWLSRIGIGLLLFGLLFLFRYSVDQGWIVPPVRVGFGAVLGAVLFAAGVRTYATRRRVGQVFFGGSVATLYTTVFAAYQLYALMPYPLAFAAMGTITVAAFALAVRQDEAALAVIGVAGGLGTPFLLYTEAGSVSGLVAYTCLVLAGSMAVYLFRGWRSLLYTTVVGGWAVLLIAGVDNAFGADLPASTRGVLQAGLVVAWLLLGGVPVLRTWLQTRNADRWSAPSLPAFVASTGWLRRLVAERPRYGLVNASPLLALAGSRLVWDAPDAVWASVALGGAALYAAAFAGLRRVPLPRYAPAHGLAAAVLAALGLGIATDGATLLLTLGVEAVALLVLGRHLDESVLRRSGHALVAVVAVWLAGRLQWPNADATPLVSAPALSELAVLALIAGASWTLQGRTSRGRTLRFLYRLAALVGWLAWTWNELVPVTNGQAYVSAVWGATAVALLVGGTWSRARRVQLTALATLGVFVAKLFLVDLAALPALWRILLFLGSGGLFLLLSYSLPGLIPPDDASTP